MRFPKLSILFVFICVTSTLNAQFHIGAKAGVNATKIDGKSFKQEFTYNYLVGAFAEIKAGKKFSVDPEVIFNQTSSTLSSRYKDVYENIIRSDQRKAKLNYLSIPILLNYQLIGPLHIEAGPQFSVLTSKDKDFVEESKDAFKGGDFSFVAGAQLRFMKFRASLRYVAGLQNINDIDNQEKWKNQAIQAAVGFTIF